MQWWSDCERDFKNSIQGGWKFWSFLHPPLMTNTPHRISSTFQAKTTWGGNILLGQDCLLKIWTNMTWNFPILLNIFCGSKSSSSSSQFWNDFDFFYSISIPSKNYTFSQTVKSSWTLVCHRIPPPSYLNFYKCFDALLSLNFWHSRSVEEVNLIPSTSQTQKWNWPRKIRRGKSPLIFILFLLLIKTFKKSSEFFSRCAMLLLAKLDCDQISTFLHDFH